MSAKIANTSLRYVLKNRRRNMILRYSAVYIVYLLVLAILLCAALLLSGDLLMKKSVRIAEETLQSGIALLEADFDAFDNVAIQFKNDLSLQQVSSRLITDPEKYPIHEVQNTLANNAALLNSNFSYGLLTKNDLLIMETFYLFADRPYLPYLFRCETYPNFDEWASYISDYRRFVPVQDYHYGNERNPVECIVYKAGAYTNDNLFFVLMPTEQIEQLLMPASGALSGRLTLSAISNGESIQLYQSSNSISSDYSITRISDSGMIITLDIDNSVINAEMQEAQTLFMQIGAAFLLIGLLCAIILAWYNTRPLMLLIDAATQLDTTGTIDVDSRPLNKEYRYFLSVMSNSSAALKAYENELERHANETRYWAFVSMLTNRDANTPLDLKHPPYGLILIDTTSEICSMVLSVVRKFLDRGRFGTSSLCALIHNTIVVLERDEQIDTLKEEMTQFLGTIPELQYRLVVTRALNNTSEIHAAYAQAAYRLSLSLPEEVYETSFIPKAPQTDATQNKLSQFSYASIYHMLTSGQIDTLTEMLDSCIQFFRNGGYASESLVRYAYESCAASLASVKTKFPEITSDLTVPEYCVEVRLENQFQLLRDLFMQVHTALRTFYERDTVTKTKQIMQFIDDNLGNPELYIKLVTSRFEISENELQAHVRNACGMSFFSYVEQARMAKARKLVCDSTLTFTQIGSQCGYSSNISFARAFSRFYGVSPSKMRNTPSGNESETE